MSGFISDRFSDCLSVCWSVCLLIISQLISILSENCTKIILFPGCHLVLLCVSQCRIYFVFFFVFFRSRVYGFV